MSVKATELRKQSVNAILFACVHSFVSMKTVCFWCVHVRVGKTIRQCFDSHVTCQKSVSGDPAFTTPDYPSMHDSYI